MKFELNNFEYLEKYLLKGAGLLLPENKKKEMWQRIELFMDEHPVREITSDRLRLGQRSSMTIWSYLLGSNFKPMAVALILALFVGGSISLAAENAMPGSALYGVKVNVNEEIRERLVLSGEARARLEAERAERRLREAEELEMKAESDIEARAEVKSRFDAHVEEFKARVEALEEKHADTAAELHSNFEAALRAHEKTLVRLENKKQDASTTLSVGTNSILTNVRSNINASIEARAEAEMKFSAKAEARVKASAEDALGAAKKKLAEARRQVENMKGKISADTYGEAVAKLETSTQALASADLKFNTEAYTEAFVEAQRAIRIAQEARKTVSLEILFEGAFRTSRMAETKTEMGAKNETSVSSDSSMSRNSGNNEGVTPATDNDNSKAEVDTKIQSGNSTTNAAVESRTEVKVKLDF